MHAVLRPPPVPKELRKIWRALSQKSPSSMGYKRENLSGDDDFLRDSSRESLIQDNRQVPKGFLAVYVGMEMRRYVIPANYLSLPEFRVLMERAEEEFGFEQEGGLRFPCEECDFEGVLVRCFEKQSSKKKNKERDKI